jgi:hypothetical protein
MRTDSRVLGAGPHPGGSDGGLGVGCISYPVSTASRPAGRMPVQQLDSKDRRPRMAGRGTQLPSCGAAGQESAARLGWDPRAQLRLRTADTREPHTCSSPLASSLGPATEFDLPTRAGGGHATCHPRRDAGPRARARGRLGDRRRQRLSIAGRYPPPTNSDSERPHT